MSCDLVLNVLKSRLKNETNRLSLYDRLIFESIRDEIQYLKCELAFYKELDEGARHSEELNKQIFADYDKIFKIIKDKEVCFHFLSGCDNVKQYNNSMDLLEASKEYHLTKEEFDLLKGEF